jgi:hypothetical protein
LSLAAIGSMGMIVLYQTGIIKHLPEPPLPGLDADTVDAAAQAYAYFMTPDGVLGLGNYAVTLGLAAMGGQNRARTHPWIPLALAAKVALDAPICRPACSRFSAAGIGIRSSFPLVMCWSWARETQVFRSPRSLARRQSDLGNWLPPQLPFDRAASV